MSIWKILILVEIFTVSVRWSGFHDLQMSCVSKQVISAISGGVGNLYNIDCILPVNIFHRSPVSGIQPTQSLYSCSGSSEVYIWGLLEDGLGAEHWNHHHDNQPGGKRQSRFIWILHRSADHISDAACLSLCVLCPFRGNVTSTGRRRTASSMETLWWRWKAPKCTPATHCGVSL